MDRNKPCSHSKNVLVLYIIIIGKYHVIDEFGEGGMVHALDRYLFTTITHEVHIFLDQDSDRAIISLQLTVNE